MRLALLALAAGAALAAAAGCGSGGGQAATTASRTAAAGPSPGQVVRRFVAAAARSDARAEWALLTPAAKRRVGPFERFRNGTATELSEGLGTFEHASDLRTALSWPFATTPYAVAGVAATRTAEGTREFSAWAVPLRRAGGSWLVDLLPPLELTPLGPAGPPTAASVEISFRLDGSAKPTLVQLWVDGHPRPLEAHGRRYVTRFAPGAGRHVAIAYARAGARAGAVAWTFRERG
ncbi:MAG TPA: hypothetical protein VFJ77_06595 [Gaiellaceae bacterium]|nr:hypothetical protein [Gaiellaceae bacterium]